MAQYFFHYRAEPPDVVGFDLPDDLTARKEGLLAFAAMLHDLAAEDAINADMDRSMIVTDQQGRTVLHIGLLTTPSDHSDA